MSAPLLLLLPTMEALVRHTAAPITDPIILPFQVLLVRIVLAILVLALHPTLTVGVATIYPEAMTVALSLASTTLEIVLQPHHSVLVARTLPLATRTSRYHIISRAPLIVSANTHIIHRILSVSSIDLS